MGTHNVEHFSLPSWAYGYCRSPDCRYVSSRGARASECVANSLRVRFLVWVGRSSRNLWNHESYHGRRLMADSAVDRKGFSASKVLVREAGLEMISLQRLQW